MTAVTIHTRAAAGPDVLAVSFEQRLIEVIAVPWNHARHRPIPRRDVDRNIRPRLIGQPRWHRPHNRAGQPGTLQGRRDR